MPEDVTQVVRSGLETACKDFSARIEGVGFKRTKRMLWTRRHLHTVDFIRLYRAGSSYGKPLNYSVTIHVNFGVRVLNDVFEALAANGPDDDPNTLRAGRYHLRFNAQTGSTYDRCVEDLTRFVLEQGEPWFTRFRETEALLSLKDSPLRARAKEKLQQATGAGPDLELVSQSLRLLGIKGQG